ncbi:MAG: ribonuclease J [Patescibacteria group bacterium]
MNNPKGPSQGNIRTRRAFRHPAQQSARPARRLAPRPIERPRDPIGARPSSGIAGMRPAERLRDSAGPRHHTVRSGTTTAPRASARAAAPRPQAPAAASELKFIPLGGCGEVTRSMYIYEYGDDIVIVDMGLQWPDEDMPGIDYLIPNIEYLKPKIRNIRGVIITHGHYDHIGAIPHLADALGNPPFYATALTRGMILKRHEDFKAKPQPKIEVITPDSRLTLGAFHAEFFHVNHNIPGSVGVVLKTPAGTAVHTGDFKFDHSPVNEKPADIARLSAIGQDGVMLLVSESTDAEWPGHQISESEVQKSLEEVFQKARGRIIAATFSSLLTRIQQLIWLSEKYGRKVILEGYSLKQNVAVARELAYLKIEKDTLIDVKDMHRYPDERITIVCTGAQGEDRSALMRIANNEHRTISIHSGDSIIFSSSVIPGNEATVQRLKDVLYKKAFKVYHYATMDLHAGGHAKREELKMMINLIRPRYLIPIHGNYFMLKLHEELAEEAGMSRSNIMVTEDGEMVCISSAGIRKLEDRAPTDYVMVDGLGVGDVKEVVIRDRQHLSEDGIFVVIVLVDSKTGKIRTSPDIISRGFVYLKESQQLLKEVRTKTKSIVEEITVAGEHPINWVHVKDMLREKIGQFLFQKTLRRPMVLPVVIEV